MPPILYVILSFVPLVSYVTFIHYMNKKIIARMSDSNKMIINTLMHGKNVNGGMEHKGIRIVGRSVGYTDEASLEISKRAMEQLKDIPLIKKTK